MNDKILANVAGIPVTESEVTGMVSELAARGQNYDNPQGRAVILEQLISNKLLLADARKNLYEHSPEFKAQLEKVKEDLLVNFAMAKVLETVKVPTDEEAKAYFEEHKDKFLGKPRRKTALCANKNPAWHHVGSVLMKRRRRLTRRRFPANGQRLPRRIFSR